MKFDLYLKLCVALAALLFLSACVSTQPEQASALTAAKSPAQTRPDGSVRFDTSNEEVARLWIAAEQARLDNRNSIALQLLYDALEINPGNSLLWSRAAELQLDSLEAALAENYAVKSNSFAGENQSLLYRNWLIIEHARSMRGDLLGVRDAHKKVLQYQFR